MIIIIKEEDTDPNIINSHWKTMATCDKDLWQSKRLLPKLKDLHDKHRSMSFSFLSHHIGQTHTQLEEAQMNLKRVPIE